MYDVIIVGGGIIGGSIFRECTKYNIKSLMLEKENDVCSGSSKANSAIVHSGYDPEENTLMAKLNVDGNKMFDQICSDLNVPFRRNGSLIIGFTDDDKETLNKLYIRGINNGVTGLSILTGKEVYEKEENLASGITCGLYAKTGGIVGVYELTIALIENAIENGGVLKRNSKVTEITKKDDIFSVSTSNGNVYKGKVIINAAGIYADEVHNLICKPSYKIFPAKGQYYVLDKQYIVNSTIFQCPTILGKGILVTPTVHGNILVGPDYNDETDKFNIGTTSHGFETIKEIAIKTANINFASNIRNFAGLRAYSDRSDFIIEEDKDISNFIDVAGIKSPGATAAPAIGKMVVDIISSKIPLAKNPTFSPKRKKVYVSHLSLKEKNDLIKENSKYGNVICRCESITEGEILDSINNPCGAISVEGVKRRCRAGAGRCQGGFCQPKVLSILARELGVNIEDIPLDRDGSYILKNNL